MTLLGCPSKEQLSNFHVGQLSAADLEHVAQHLDLCPQCASSLAGLNDRDDPLVGALRTSEALQFAQPSEAEKIVALVEKVGLEVSPLAPRGRGVGGEGDSPAAPRLGQYLLLEKLGEGAMGEVYKARHALMDRLVAVKVINAKFLAKSGAVERFQREIRALARLDCPNIVRADYADQEGNTHYLVMEFVQGVNLAKLVQRTGPLQVPQACACILHAARGLQHAHERGLVHRDLKPSNLILTSDGLVKILDMGLALWRQESSKELAEDLTAAGQVLGTRDYLAPEQAEDPHQATIRADIYSLGCTLYFLLAGKAPFHGPQYSSATQKLLAHATVPVPCLKERRPDVPDQVLAVLGRMLAKDPAQRYAVPAELAADLEPLAASADLQALAASVPPTTAPAEAVSLATTVYEKARGKVRGRTKILALAAAICLLVGAAWLIPWPWLSSDSGPSEPGTNANPGQLPASAPVRIVSFYIEHYRGENATYQGKLGDLSLAAHFDDDVRVHAHFSALAYCYLIAFNPDGKEQPCFPKDPAVAPLPVAQLVYPETKYFGLTDGVGLQAFVLLATRDPLPPYAEWKARHGPSPWKTEKAAGVWRFDGRQMTLLAPERGPERDGSPTPKSFLELANYLQAHAPGMALEALAFPVKDMK